MSFVHLHVHSEYSLLEATTDLKKMTETASRMGMPALALTDNGNMFGAIEFYFACQSKNIKPIIGLDAYVASGSRWQKSSDQFSNRLVLLAQNRNGYENLCRISSAGYQEGFYYKPRIDFEVLEKWNSDLILLSGGLQGLIAQTFLKEGPDKALEKIKKIKAIFSDRFYLELNRTGLPEWKKINAFLLESSRIAHVPVVAANDVHYLERDDQVAQEVLICIGTNKTLQDETRLRLGSDQFYFKSPEEMKSLFQDVPEAVSNTLEVAERCQLKFRLKDEQGKPIYFLPSYPTRDGASLEEEIRRQSEEGLRARFQELEAGKEIITDQKIYWDRLHYELSVIHRMGFDGYFLIVADFINWAKSQNIPVGPGRGSGAGSLVAYSLKITDLDPIPYGLLFERFLNPERISMPDFDIDFCQDRRPEVIQYVTQKYGSASVSQIITYGKLQCRAAIKDVGRVLGMTFSEVDAVTKLVPEKLNITIDEALEMEPRLRELMETNPTVSTLISLAQRVEGLVRHAGIHAAGIIIADGELVKHAPLYKGADGENVVQYDMKHAEKIGLIKFDFLGLKTLTLIHRAFQLIKVNRQLDLSPHQISLRDPGIYEIMRRGDTAGIFQFEGEGMTDAIRKIGPTSFFDIMAINALYRPGPMAMIPDYAKRKNGEAPVDYLFEELKGTLQETYGIIVYQEQVMAIASQIAGYSLGEADMLRRAMGKKIKEEMDHQRVRFLQGAEARGFDKKKSEELFELMNKFADYGFNKSHAAAYCVVAAQTAWLKNYYPAEFYAATLSTELGDTDKVVRYVKDAQKHGIKVLPPHINRSEFLFNVVGDDVYFGLGAIKGVGESAISAILDARKNTPRGRFETLDEFFNSVDIKKINKKVIECLIKAGAMDGFGFHRAELMNGYQKYVDYAETQRRDREVGQGSLFAMTNEPEKVKIENVHPWSRTLALRHEKEVLGFYLSDHPLHGIENLATQWVTCPISQLSQIPMEKKKRVVVSGIIVEKREQITKKGTRMAFAKLEDLSGSIELVIFPDVYSQVEYLLSEERPLLVGGFLENEPMKVMVDSVALLEDTFSRAKKIVVRLDGIDDQGCVKLDAMFRQNPGSTQLELQISVPELNHSVSILPEGIKGVKVSSDLFERIQSEFGRTDFMEMR